MVAGVALASENPHLSLFLHREDVSNASSKFLGLSSPESGLENSKISGACLGIWNKPQQLICISAFRKADDHVHVGHDAKISVQGIRWVQVESLAASRDKSLGDFLSNEATLAHPCEEDDSLALQADLQASRQCGIKDAADRRWMEPCLQTGRSELEQGRGRAFQQAYLAEVLEGCKLQMVEEIVYVSAGATVSFTTRCCAV